MSVLIEFFENNNIDYLQNVSLKDISTFRIGGNADIICYPDSSESVSNIVKFCVDNGIHYFSFGKCSNVVFSDNGLKTLIIKTDKLEDISLQNDEFTFGAGVMLAKAAKYTVDNSFAGMEFAYGIPGSVGGAVYMNAGAYGGEMSQCVVRTEYVDENGEIKIIDGSEHDFGYRHSFFSNKNCVITKTFIKLKKGNREESESEIQRLQEMRKSKQPLEFPSAGSVFKRPEGYFAGKLIQDCNLCGVSVGGAKVSEKHAGFIINFNNASCNDVKNLVDLIKDRVKSEFGVQLECELKFLEDVQWK